MPDDQPTVPETDPATPPPDLAAEVEKWKAMSRKHEAGEKANADKAKQFDAAQEAAKSDLEKATARAEAAEKAALLATLERDRTSVALAKGLTPTQAKRLVGTTREELEADADELLTDLATPAKPTSPPKPPGGSGVGAPNAGSDPDRDLARSLFGSQK